MKTDPNQFQRARSLLVFRALPFAGQVAGVLGLAALGYWAFLFLGAHLYQSQGAEQFMNEERFQEMSSEPLEKRYPVRGSAVALLAVPRLGLSTLVIEGADEHELKLAPGHIPGTSLPGGGGNVGVAGHRDTFFRPLRYIRKDDAIKVSAAGREYEYSVVSTEIVGPENVNVLSPLDHETLTLVTCYPFDFIGPAPKRFIVRADCTDCELDRGER